MNDATTLLVMGVVTVLASGGFATIVVRFMERRKVDADTHHTNATATDVLVTAGEKAVGILESQLDRALERIEQLEQEVVDLRSHIARLESET